MSMRKMIVNLALLAGTGALFLTPIGCQDAADAAADAKVKAINTAQANYNKATSGDSQALQEVARALSSNSTGSDGLSAAAALIEAGVRMEIALGKLSQASVVEAENRGHRQAILGIVGGSQILDGVVAGLNQYNGDEAQSVLEQALATSRTELERVQSTITRLEGPYNDFTSKNTRDQAMVVEMRNQSAGHREAAFNFGDGPEGLKEVKSAVAIDRKADQLENAIAQRAVALIGISLELQLANIHTERLQAQIETIINAQNLLVKSKSDYTANANKIKSESGTNLSKQFTDTRNVIDSNTTGKLNSIYNECGIEISSAISKCDAASRGSDRSTVALLKVRAHQLSAQLHEMKARALDDQSSMLAILAESGRTLGNSADFTRELNDITTTLSAEQAAAKTAYGEALNALNNVSGSVASEVAPLKAQLQQAAGV